MWQSSQVPYPTRPLRRVLLQSEVESSPVGRGCWSQASQLNCLCWFWLLPCKSALALASGDTSPRWWSFPLSSSRLGTWFPPQQRVLEVICADPSVMSGAQWCPQGNFYWQVLCGLVSPPSEHLQAFVGLEVWRHWRSTGWRSVIPNPQL